MSTSALSVGEARGFTLVEVMVAGLLLVIGVLGTISLIDGANAATSSTRAHEGATSLARQLVEGARAIPYPRLTQQTIEGELQGQPGLEDSSAGGGWTIRRRDVTYEVVATVCSVDDPKDETGAREGAGWCPDSPAGTASSGTDSDPDDYRRVEIGLAWTDVRGSEETTTQTTIVNNPGNAAGPVIVQLELVSPHVGSVGAPTILDDGSEASFDLTTSTVPATVAWSVDGSVMGEAVGSGLAWSFDWPLEGVDDGTYTVGARAYATSGAFGPTRSTTVTLNRFEPEPPAEFAAGRNGDVIELEWEPNPEGDIVGYRVYRLSGGTRVGEPVCETKRKTACLDASPPPDERVEYEAVALDLDESDAVREGQPSVAVALQGNNPPNPPTDLAAERVDGVTTLTWTAPELPDPDPGDGIAFYRIYRDGTAFEDRYDRTGTGDVVSYTDTRTGGTAHDYWITAVDSQLAESVVVGPVRL